MARNGGLFNVPGVPGASGYATVSVPPGFGIPFVLLAGFDLKETHLVAEQIDYGDPTVTAADVVDRETLKAFVTEAGDYMVDILETGTLVDVAKSKVAFRDPNGPWRHGSVYLYALDLNSNIILFHGAFPNRFENRPLVATVRDAVTGEFILPQVLAAAASNPEEGGFVEYYFDDPTDPNDRADIPKTGFAREFTARVGPQATIKFVVGSGFYRECIARSRRRRAGNAVIESVLPQVDAGDDGEHGRCRLRPRPAGEAPAPRRMPASASVARPRSPTPSWRTARRSRTERSISPVCSRARPSTCRWVAGAAARSAT